VLTLADVATVLVTLGGVRSAAAHDFGAGQWPLVMLTQADFWLASAPVGAGVWLWLAWANGRGYHWARTAFAAFFGLLTVVVFVGLGGDRLPYTWRDVLATAVLWLVALVTMGLIFSQAASRYYQRRAAARAAAPASGTGR
jgi:predicted neutral ceramidase superfamily lipid hydrolase